MTICTTIADKIRDLRDSNGLTQASLAKQLGITRSSINAWEMGISTPSTQYLLELSRIFKVSVDYLLSLDNHSSIDVSGLSSRQVAMITEFVHELRLLNSGQTKE